MRDSVVAAAAPARRNTSRALVIAPDRGLTFVEDDIRILAMRYDLDVLTRREYPSRRRLLTALLRRFLRARYALVYIWFVEPYDSPYVVWLTRIFRIPCVLVPGGYDLAALPTMHYGALTTRHGRYQVQAALFGANLVLPTSHLLANEARLLGRTHAVRVIYPGLDCEYFTPDGRDKERLVVTVATVAATTARVKGLDVFARCSRQLPDVQFAILGPCTEPRVAADLRAQGGANLTIVGEHLPPERLLRWYQRAAVYAQLSARESFGMALAEAMACVCVPVATSVGALPEVIGDAGFFVDYADVTAAARAIARALDSDLGARARARVQARYGLERRRRELHDTLAAVVGSS